MDVKLDISKKDGKTILLNGKPSAATYKADRGTDDAEEFILLTDMAGSYRQKLRLHQLTVNGITQGCVEDTCTELNAFIGNFKQGAVGGDEFAERKLYINVHTGESGYRKA